MNPYWRMPLYKYMYSKRTIVRIERQMQPVIDFPRTETNAKTVTVDCAIMNWNL